jgi:hypothetical protein
VKLLRYYRTSSASDLKKTTGQYNRFDFISSGCMIELKSRRCSVNTYNDTMVGLNKLEYAKKHTDKKVYSALILMRDFTTTFYT